MAPDDLGKTLFEKNSQVAWVGSGGKSTLLFNFARRYFPLCIVTTSTHLGFNQQKLADTVFSSVAHFLGSFHLDPNLKGVVLVTNGVNHDESDKLSGLSDEDLNNLSIFCKENNLPLFIEADGSRQLPVKAPAAHEPAIPKFVDTVCVVIGLSGLGQPINGETVQRPEIYKKIIGENTFSERVDWENLEKYLVNPLGGLKNILPSSKKYLFLNQADVVDDKDTVEDFAGMLTSTYDAVVISQKAGIQETGILAIYRPLACVILAAGKSSRFGKPKQLQQWKGQTFIDHVINIAKRNHLSPVFVVLGSKHKKIRSSIKKHSVNILINNHWEDGQSSSLRVGIEAIPKNREAVIILLVDQPQLPDLLIKNLKKEYAHTHAEIIVHELDGTFRHPVLFSRTIFNELTGIKGDVGGRAIFQDHQLIKIPLEKDIWGHDIDTISDLDRLNNNLS